MDAEDQEAHAGNFVSSSTMPSAISIEVAAVSSRRPFQQSPADECVFIAAGHRNHGLTQDASATKF
jgi:hypothetical protein